ncbi:YdeI/OmpD-associated family protein [Bradyrhizobium sp. CCBAU 53421]|uniref:YdeI/OmpD-associated family protein n=1 Tax=Bradyrhizobium sp. CCBAU 53421 TaxID=1325120 RepID=UPI001FEF26EA|nr:YdeI/OmpD-associated family protein [Bradyrhizobium sp. CCBAU 53421]
MERPAYQRNDYLHWIGRSIRDATRRKRIDQMLEELKAGGVYMGMAHRPNKQAR